MQVDGGIEAAVNAVPTHLKEAKAQGRNDPRTFAMAWPAKWGARKRRGNGPKTGVEAQKSSEAPTSSIRKSRPFELTLVTDPGERGRISPTKINRAAGGWSDDNGHVGPAGAEMHHPPASGSKPAKGGERRFETP